ncbi:BtpA family membrane complex biogenesis protein, partial [Escherichia coli]|nr:BtpA family membrane complex biogenesis protein [Escherichia coli]
MQEISDRSSNAVQEIFGTNKVLIGMIHCPAFPGAPRYRGADMDTIYDACMRDAEACVEGGLHGL